MIERIKKRRDYLAAANHKQAQRKIMPALIILAAPRSEKSVAGEAPRAGFTASRKVGNAVRRNRARRRMKALAEMHLPRWGQKTHDYVFIARHAMPDLPAARLAGQISAALKKLAQRA